MSTDLFSGPTVEVTSESVAQAARQVHDRAAVRKAIISALPVDWEDYTTLVQVTPVPDEGGVRTLWGRPERVADAVIAALQPFLEVDTDELDH